MCQLAVTAGGVASKDFTNSACHTYSVVLSPDEIHRVMSTLATAAMAQPEAFAHVYGGTLPELVQLQAVVAGVVRSAPGRDGDPTAVREKK